MEHVTGVGRAQRRPGWAKVTRISILGLMVLVALAGLILGLFARFGADAFFYLTGPLVGATLAGLTCRPDRTAVITGGVIGGIAQGVFAVMVLKLGYPFADITMMTGPLFLAALAAHMLAGLAVGALIYLTIRWARPRPVSRLPEPDSARDPDRHQ
jgi:hypothetical protein